LMRPAGVMGIGVHLKQWWFSGANRSLIGRNKDDWYGLSLLECHFGYIRPHDLVAKLMNLCLTVFDDQYWYVSLGQNTMAYTAQE
jgi:hypothetical protein